MQKLNQNLTMLFLCLNKRNIAQSQYTNLLLQEKIMEAKKSTKETSCFCGDCWKKSLTYFDGKLHSFSGNPAYIKIFKSGYTKKKWYQDGLLHKMNGAALVIHFMHNGDSEEYYLHGKQMTKKKYWKKLSNASS